MLDKAAVVTDPAAIEPANQEWTNHFHGQSKLLLKPKSNEEVAAVLKYCNQEKIAIVPQGGNTGLVGGQTPVFDEVVLSLSNLNQIMGFDESYGIVTSQAGAVLQDLQDYLGNHGYTMPIDLGAKGSC